MFTMICQPSFGLVITCVCVCFDVSVRSLIVSVYMSDGGDGTCENRSKCLYVCACGDWFVGSSVFLLLFVRVFYTNI